MATINVESIAARKEVTRSMAISHWQKRKLSVVNRMTG